MKLVDRRLDRWITKAFLSGSSLDFSLPFTILMKKAFEILEECEKIVVTIIIRFFMATHIKTGDVLFYSCPSVCLYVCLHILNVKTYNFFILLTDLIPRLLFGMKEHLIDTHLVVPSQVKVICEGQCQALR